MQTKTVKPLEEMLGVDGDSVPVNLGDICDNPIDGWSRIKVFTHTGAMCYFTARLYRRDIPEHDFFKVRNKAVIDKSIPFQEVSRCLN